MLLIPRRTQHGRGSMGNSNSPENGLLDNALLQVPLKHLRADYYKMNGREVLMTVQGAVSVQQG